MIEFILNEKQVSTSSDPSSRLLDVLREEFGLTGPKEGCGEGECGACAVLIDGKLINACLVALGSVHKHSVMTIEGFAQTKRFAVLEAAFAEAGAVQCGFCIPGVVMAAEQVLSTNGRPTDEEIRLGLSGNLCRCTGYETMVEAVHLASERGAGTLWPNERVGEEV